MTGTIVALVAKGRQGTIRAEDGSRLVFSAAAVLGDFDALAIGHHVSFDVERMRSMSRVVRLFREPGSSGGVAKKPGDPANLRYSGFDQAGNLRSYRFDAIGTGQPIPHCVTVDLALLLKHHIGMQEAPALCLHKLSVDLRDHPAAGSHHLEDEDLLALELSRATAQRKRPRRIPPGRRGSPPPAPPPVH